LLRQFPSRHSAALLNQTPQKANYADFHFICMAVSYLVPYRKQATQETLKTVYAVLIPFKAQYLLLRIINRAFQWTLGERFISESKS